ncbi:MAG: dihydroneopterin aldolase [Chloroflexi bacterium]|nr:dihydroneopterin aldolase [Chloroflexota bacterium]
MPSDQIILQGMRFYGYHGVNPEEKILGQTYIVDLEAKLDLTRPGNSDDLEDTVSYSHIYRSTKAIVEGESRNLLEALAQSIADRTLADFPVEAVSVTVKKPNPPIKGSFIEHAAVRIYRRRENDRQSST